MFLLQPGRLLWNKELKKDKGIETPSALNYANSRSLTEAARKHKIQKRFKIATRKNIQKLWQALFEL